MRNKGFTLVEMLLAVSLLAVVLVEFYIIMVGVFRLEKNRMWDAEFADKLRAAREQILFRAVPPDADGGYFGGLLSATNVNWMGGQMSASFQRSEKGKASQYEATTHNLSERFFIPDLDDGQATITDVEVTNSLMFVSLSSTINGSNRVERLSVPAFGKFDGSLWEEFLTIENESDIQWRQGQ